MADPGFRIISSIGELDVDDDRATISGRWTEFCELVDNQILAQGMNYEAKKNAGMLHIGGPQLWRLVKNLVITPRLAVQADPIANPSIVSVHKNLADYEALERVFFMNVSTPNITSSSTSCISGRVPKPETKLWINSAAGCANVVQPSSNYLNQQSPKSSQHQQQQSSGKSLSKGIDRPSWNRIKKDCQFCGGRFHEDGLSTCPARDKQYRHCNNLGHFEKMCQIKAHNWNRKDNTDRRDKKVSFSSGRGGTRATDENDEDDSIDVDSFDAVMSSGAGSKLAVVLILLEKQIDFLLDTGQPPLFPTSKRIFAYK